MAALLSRFRAGDRVRVDARDEFYAFIDGWRATVIAHGPRAANPVHSQVPDGYCAIEAEGGKIFLVPHDQLAFDL
ncbi:hypothetical protein DF107_05805 [Burkholderia stagnalis]|uniref:hypothetical protein n=1 Tax=Burkholderia stagnalis TaxID=1503054 RepID=UPI000F5B1E0E|nr:hypothetical protein [Burkholderia stagnalis]RQQ20799.1 hypothetical protein DF161_03770 [Burkholderia stagnalis]RQY45485.1 hypothetical protein DF113_05420 [Burkholderia stagnalis]RQY84429.1 hypothetical protein DF107_05805 [Burkholderia stagnalis]